jgi:hypothetical protein
MERSGPNRDLSEGPASRSPFPRGFQKTENRQIGHLKILHIGQLHLPETYHLRVFSRSVRLPGEVDEEDVDASYKDGVLKVVMKAREGAGRRKIEIKS